MKDVDFDLGEALQNDDLISNKKNEIQRLIDEIAGENLPRHLLFDALDDVKTMLSYVPKDTSMAYVDYIIEACDLPAEYRSAILKDINARRIWALMLMKLEGVQQSYVHCIHSGLMTKRTVSLIFQHRGL